MPDGLAECVAVRSGIGVEDSIAVVMPEQVTSGTISLLYVLFQYPTLSQTFVRNEVHGLRELGATVDVVSIEEGDSAHIDRGWAGDFRFLGRPGLRRATLDHIWFAVRHPRSYRRYLFAVARLREYWRLALQRLPTEARRLRSAGRPHACHTHFAWDTASPAVYLSRLLDVPASVTVHANDIYVANAPVLRTRLEHFDRVVTVCNFNVGLLNGMGVSTIGAGDVDVVPCGVEVPARSTGDGAAMGTDIVSVGRLVEKKGFDSLIRALALVRERLPDLRATIVGEGPERDRLDSLIAELGLQCNVILAGANSHHATLELIERAKVFCLASQPARNGDCDALPVVIREAMARSVPVISTRVAGIPETVDEEVGWLVDPRSPGQLADAIAAALGDDAERVRRGRAGRARVMRRWTVQDQAAGILRVFERPTGEPRSED
ncbi:MAG TPA: glycosyltransferase [Solirubrobacteraceae bacterium]|nr:glycosyltransferase [Solirubrobacteraceae bacterium]